MSRAKSVFYGAISGILTVAGSVVTLEGVRLTIAGHVDDGVKALAAGLVLLLAASVDRFESLKGLSMEVKMRKTIDEAEVLIERLRGLSALTGKTLVSLGARVGRWDSALSPRESYALACEVRQTLEDAGVDQAAIRSAITPWAHVMLFDLAGLATNAIHGELNELLKHRMPSAARDDEERARLTQALELRDTLRINCQPGDPLTTFPQRLRSNLERAMPLLPGDATIALRERLTPWLEQMDYTAKNLDLRDPEQWFAGLMGSRPQ
ncbi:hypothetical protein [Thiomonas delicata]|uniref:Uncharacterized protein n=1 Tax=Thiomonas delicata TaxID=364030 RepID=A0A238D007_THIDL|nr:hypothetical protein [Thiomonas delicata]SBP86583.1 conserved hypothetical protein [Thiomonas delicata]